jgi:hypothetical protein
MFNSILKDRRSYFYKLIKYNLETKELTYIKNSDRVFYFTIKDDNIYTIRAYTGVFKIFKEIFYNNKLNTIDELYVKEIEAVEQSKEDVYLCLKAY